MDGETPENKTEFTFTPISPDNSRNAPTTGFYIAQLALRTLVIGFTLSGIISMVTSAQSVTVFGLVMDARYAYSSALRFKLIADCVVCGLCVLSVIHVINLTLHLPKSNPKNYFYLVMHDLVSLVLLVSGCSASMAIGYVAKFGEDHMGWMAICDRVGTFCHKTTVSIVSSFIALIFLLLLTLMSAHHLIS